MKSKLSKQDAESLIEMYEGEIRQLEYKIGKCKEAITDLKKGIGKAKSSTTSTSSKRGRGRPRKVVLEAGDPTGPGTPKRLKKKEEKPNAGKEQVKLVIPKVTPRKPRTLSGKKGGYRLSEWDHFVLGTLEDFGKVMINSELYDLALKKNKEEKMGLDDEGVRGKLVRSIHKLANKRMEIAKAPFPGKGFAYGLAAWFTSGGNLKKTYKR